MSPEPPVLQKRIFVIAPTGSDAASTTEVLAKAGFPAEAHHTLASAVEELPKGCGLLVLTEEALNSAHRAILTRTLALQPTWSNIPIVLIASGGKLASPRRTNYGFEPKAHITLLERPLRVATLLATVEAAWGTRLQQYEIRDLLEEREKLLNSLEQRVVERTAKLQAMVGEMEAFSYSVSHDLRAPLRVLDGYAQALREDYADNLPKPAHELLDKISNAAQRMDRLTQDLLAYTRIANSDLVLEKIDLDKCLDEIIESYPSLREARDQIIIHLPLGAVMGHAPSLAQCFSNLLENALKFARLGVPARVEVSSERHGDHLRVTVSDNGIGIAPREQERIFGLFERGGDQRTPGTGIGLAIIKKAVERMNGGVGVKSAHGKGSRFWIDLQAVVEK